MSFPTYGEYKDSGVEWIGRIPLHWKVDRFKRSTARVTNGLWGNEANGDEYDIACVRVADFDRESLTTKSDIPTIRNAPESERRGLLLSKGDLLLEKSGGGDLQPVGLVVLYDRNETAICSNFIAKIELAKCLSPSFWRHCHSAAYSARLNVRSIKQTSGIQNLDQSQYLDEKAPFPPLEEQKAIASFLDVETSKIDTLVAEQRRLIELLKEKRQAVISHAVTKGLNPNAPMKPSGIPWLGDVPAHWEARSISSLTTKITNGYVGPTREILVNEGVRYLQSLHIKQNQIRFDTPYYVTQKWSNEKEKSILKSGDVLIVQTGDIGQVAVVPDDFANCNCHALIILTPKKGVTSGEWISWVLNSGYGFHSLQSIKTGALHPHLNCGNVKQLKLPLPPKDEQSAIAHYVQGRLTVLDDHISASELSIELLQERRTALITAAVTGKIDVRSFATKEASA